MRAWSHFIKIRFTQSRCRMQTTLKLSQCLFPSHGRRYWQDHQAVHIKILLPLSCSYPDTQAVPRYPPTNHHPDHQSFFLFNYHNILQKSLHWLHFWWKQIELQTYSRTSTLFPTSGIKTTSLTQGYKWSSWDNAVFLPMAPFYWNCPPLLQNELLWSLDQTKYVAMVVIDLPAAFDTLNHSILLHRQCRGCYGIKGKAHVWIKSYLTDRRQLITIKGDRSEVQAKYCDVAQRLVLCLRPLCGLYCFFSGWHFPQT